MSNKINKDEVLDFITDFLYHQHKDEIAIVLIKQFRAGYCYHFAHILKSTFHRGQVCWAAPFGHIVWKDIDQRVYDIEGEYVGEAFYFIPIEKLGPMIRDFTRNHHDIHPPATRSKLIEIMKNYCVENEEVYNESVEGYL